MKFDYKILLILISAILVACASMGTPDGGPYDEMPPKFVGSSPRLHAVNVKNQKIELAFDEFIKLEKASEKVVVSPPQLDQPELKVVGKKVVMELIDTLKDATTYTIDFSDAIVDNNEKNVLQDYTFAFSTGDKVDSLQISGVVLDSRTLQPQEGLTVGVYQNYTDTTFTTTPFDRITRTNKNGEFVLF